MYKKVFSLLLCMILVLSFSINAFAEESDSRIIPIETGNDVEIRMQVPEEITYIEGRENDAEDSRDDYLISNPVTINKNDIITFQSRDVVAGDGQGYLTGTNDMKFYPLQLNPGVYLQAQMIQPSVASLDYDLYILDADGYILKYSCNDTYLNGTSGTLVESVGIYTTGTTQAIYYIAVVSANGGSVNDPFTIQYSVSNSYDTLEPSENPSEALPFTLGTNGASISVCSLSSPIDNDWYYIDVPETRIYDKLKIGIETESSNDILVEVYRNTSSSGYAMSKVFTTTSSAFMNVSTGRYYVRICNNCTMDDFDDTDIQNYTFSVIPRLVATGIIVDEYDGNEGVNHYVSYPGYSRQYFRTSTWIKVSGYVTATDPDTGVVYGVADHDVSVMYYNPYWDANNTPSMATRIESGISDSNGHFAITISNLPTPMGACTWNAGLTTQYFDICGISAYLTEQPSIISADEFVHYKYSLYN